VKEIIKHEMMYTAEYPLQISLSSNDSDYICSELGN